MTPEEWYRVAFIGKIFFAGWNLGLLAGLWIGKRARR